MGSIREWTQRLGSGLMAPSAFLRTQRAVKPSHSLFQGMAREEPFPAFYQRLTCQETTTREPGTAMRLLGGTMLMASEIKYDAAVEKFLSEQSVAQRIAKHPANGPRCACGNMRNRAHKVCKACRRQ